MRAMKSSSNKSPAVAFYRPGNYTTDESMGYLMKQIVNALGQQVGRKLESSSLTNAQWMPLYMLYKGRASTVADLARETQMDAGAMTRLLDRLEAKGLCTRVRSEQDRRVVNLELSAEGREVAKTIPAVLCEVQNAHLQGFSQDEWRLLIGFLQRLQDNAQSIAQDGEKNAA